MKARLRSWARAIKTEALTLHYAVRDPRTPWYAKALGAAVIAYALSPIDLIPDFIPVLGHLDDFLLIPAGVWAVRRLIPAHVMNDARERARRSQGKPGSQAISPTCS